MQCGFYESLALSLSPFTVSCYYYTIPLHDFCNSLRPFLGAVMLIAEYFNRIKDLSGYSSLRRERYTRRDKTGNRPNTDFKAVRGPLTPPERFCRIINASLRRCFRRSPCWQLSSQIAINKPIIGRFRCFRNYSSNEQCVDFLINVTVG